LGSHALALLYSTAQFTPLLVLQEATFLPDVEQQELAGALEQWRSAVQGVAASGALQIRLAEQQLVVAVGR